MISGYVSVTFRYVRVHLSPFPTFPARVTFHLFTFSDPAASLDPGVLFRLSVLRHHSLIPLRHFRTLACIRISPFEAG